MTTRTRWYRQPADCHDVLSQSLQEKLNTRFSTLFSLLFHSFLHSLLVFPTTGVFVFPAYYLFHIIKCLCLLAWLSLSWPFADPSGSELRLFLYVYAFKCKSHNNSRELKIVSWRCCCCVLLCSGVNNQSQKRKKSCVCLWTGTALGIRVAGKTVVALWRGFADRERKWQSHGYCQKSSGCRDCRQEVCLS